MARNSQVQVPSDTAFRVVDGVQSSQTYVVLATREGKRVALRFLKFFVSPEDQKYSVNLYCKVHLEFDGDRQNVSQRTPGFFGQSSENYHMHSNRATGLFTFPICYLPIQAEKLKERLVRNAVIDLLFKTFVVPTVELGGQAAITKAQLAQWMLGETEKYAFPTAEGAASRQLPALELKWKPH